MLSYISYWYHAIFFYSTRVKIPATKALVASELPITSEGNQLWLFSAGDVFEDCNSHEDYVKYVVQ